MLHPLLHLCIIVALACCATEHCLFQPCTENLFFVLFHEFRVTLSPVLLEMIQSNHALVSPSDLSAILRKDAVYNAAGLAAFDLYDEVRGYFLVNIIHYLNFFRC
jgi:hypothetical protein